MRTVLGAALATVLAGALAVAPPAHARPSAASSSSGGTFATVTAFRAVDRSGVPPRSTVAVPVLGVRGVPSTGVAAVSVTLTAAAATQPGYLVAWASGTTRPLASNLNFAAQRAIANSAVVPVGADGKIAVYNGSTGRTRIAVDVNGYYRSGSATVPGALTTQTPVRRLDTRTGLGGTRPGPSGTVAVDVGVTNAPVLLDLTAVAPTGAGHLLVHDHGTATPSTNLTFAAGTTIANQVIVPVGSSGKIDIENDSSAATDIVLDLTGRFVPGRASDPGTYTSVAPAQVFDSRATGQDDWSSRPVPIGGRAGVPTSGVAAVALEVTIVDPESNGYLDAGTGSSIGGAVSRINFQAGRDVEELMVVPIAADGTVRALPYATTDVVVDVVGYVRDGTDVEHGSITGYFDVAAGPATVRAYDGSRLVASTRTFAPSRFALTGLPTTSTGYAVCVDPDTADYEPTCYLAGAYSGSTAPTSGFEPVPAPNGGTSSISYTLQSRSSAYGALTGRVADARGVGVAGVDVTVAPTSNPSAVGVVAHTDDYGAYRSGYLSYLDPGSYVVCFQPGQAPGTSGVGFRPRCYDGAVDTTSATPVQITAGRVTRGIDGRLPAGGAIAGRVTERGTGHPLSATAVTVWDADHENQIGDVVDTDGDGTYRVVGLPASSGYQVCFDGTYVGEFGHLSECYGTEDGTAPDLVPVSVGSTTSGIDAALRPGGVVVGNVHASNGDVVFGALVEAYDASGRPVQTADNDGDYRLSGLAPGSYTICVDSDGAQSPASAEYQDQCYRNVVWDGTAPPPAAATPVAVRANEQTTGISFILQKN